MIRQYVGLHRCRSGDEYGFFLLFDCLSGCVRRPNICRTSSSWWTAAIQCRWQQSNEGPNRFFFIILSSETCEISYSIRIFKSNELLPLTTASSESRSSPMLLSYNQVILNKHLKWNGLYITIWVTWTETEAWAGHRAHTCAYCVVEWDFPFSISI